MCLTHRPNIEEHRVVPVRGVTQHFRRHVTPRPAAGVQQHSPVVVPTEVGQSEVGHLHPVAVVDQNVGRLEIPVRHVQAVQVLDGRNDLSEQMARGRLRVRPVLFYQLSDIAVSKPRSPRVGGTRPEAAPHPPHEPIYVL